MCERMLNMCCLDSQLKMFCIRQTQRFTHVKEERPSFPLQQEYLTTFYSRLAMMFSFNTCLSIVVLAVACNAVAGVRERSQCRGRGPEEYVISSQRPRL